jgi:hypothetical protein
MSKEQISEEFAREILLETSLIKRGDLKLCIKRIINDLKEKGYIKQSREDELKEIIKDYETMLKGKYFYDLENHKYVKCNYIEKYVESVKELIEILENKLR